MKTVDERGGRVRVTGEGGGGMRRGCFVWLLIAAILLGTLAVLVRLDGGRQMLESFLSKRLEMPVTVESSRIGLPYDLVLMDVRATGEAGGSLHAREVRIGLRADLSRRIRIERLTAELRRDEHGRWHPAGLAAAGDAVTLDPVDVTRLTAGWRRRNALAIRDGAVRWLGSDAQELAAVSGFNFSVHPAELAGRRYYCFEFEAYLVQHADGRSEQNTALLWLAGHDRDFIEIEGGRK